MKKSHPCHPELVAGKAPWQTARYACRLARCACRSSSQKSRSAAIFGSPVFSAQSIRLLSLSFRPSNASGEILRGSVLKTNSFCRVRNGSLFCTRSLHSLRSVGMTGGGFFDTVQNLPFYILHLSFAQRRGRVAHAARGERVALSPPAILDRRISNNNFFQNSTFYILHFSLRSFVALLLRMTGRVGICSLLAFPLGGRCRRSRRKRGVGFSKILHLPFYIQKTGKGKLRARQNASPFRLFSHSACNARGFEV